MAVSIQKSENIFVSAEGYWLEGYHYANDVLVVAFENAGGAQHRPDGYRAGWSSNFLRKRGISHLCVKPLNVDWYQGEGLIEAFAHLRDTGFFSRYKSIISYGSSMGGFAALLYADVIGADKVLSFNPQTAMKPRTVPFERRWWRVQTSHSWDGPFSDAIGKFTKATHVLIAADMHHWQDKKHVFRILEDKVQVINTPYLGHGTPAWLGAMGLLSGIVLNTINGSKVDEAAIYRGLRKRRQFDGYYNQLLSKRRVKSSPKLLKIVTDARDRAKREKEAKH